MTIPSDMPTWMGTVYNFAAQRPKGQYHKAKMVQFFNITGTSFYFPLSVYRIIM